MTVAVALTEKLYTVAEFLELDLPDNEEFELIRGQLVQCAITSGKHGDIVTRVATYLNLVGGAAAGNKRRGTVYSGSSTTLGNPDGKNYLKPDVCFVLFGNGPTDFDGPISVAPDIVVEVNSPSDTDERRFDKLQAYQQAGVKLIWSIHMLEKFVVVYQKDGLYPQFLTRKDELNGGDILPELKIPVKALFE